MILGKLDLLFHISHLLHLHGGGRYIIYYLLLANTRYTQQICGATAIKSGRVFARKVIMTVEVAGLRGSGRG